MMTEPTDKSDNSTSGFGAGGAKSPTTVGNRWTNQEVKRQHHGSRGGNPTLGGGTAFGGNGGEVVVMVV